MKVELGAGARPQEGWLAFDVNPAHASVVGDARRLPFRTASIDALRAVDVLEHCSYRDTHDVLREWARAARPGAHLYVQVPDAGTLIDWYQHDDARLRQWRVCGQTLRCDPLLGFQWRLLGGHADGVFDDGGDWRWNAHFALFTRGALDLALARSGWRVLSIQRNDHPNLLADAERE